MNSFKNNKGFSLIELLAVVAIIGILAVIGIPQYKQFKIKAFQAEAKTQLATVYAAEAAFFTEFNGYHHSLQVIGYAPHGRARYNVGFGTAGVTPVLAPTETNFLNSKSICSGPFGEGVDPNCQMIVDVPLITSASTVGSSMYQVSAVAYDEFLAQNGTTSTSMIARMVIGSLAHADGELVEDQSMIDGWYMNEKNILSHDKIIYDCLYASTCAQK